VASPVCADATKGVKKKAAIKAHMLNVLVMSISIVRSSDGMEEPARVQIATG